jgi:hypothetical protein
MSVRGIGRGRRPVARVANPESVGACVIHDPPVTEFVGSALATDQLDDGALCRGPRAAALNALFQQVYDELRVIAQRHL